MLEIKKEGNWVGVKLALQNLPLQVRSSAVWGQQKVATKLVKIVKKHINSQDLGWVPRSAKSRSNDPRILVDSEAYYGSIKAWRTGDTYNAGVPANAFNARGMRIADYAAMNEYGADNLPARPLWAPSFKELGGKKGVSSIVTAAIFEKVRRLRAVGLDVKIGTI